MIRSILSTIALGSLAVFSPLSADPVEVVNVNNITIADDLIDEYTQSSEFTLQEGDELMPSLVELLGEPVDDFGFLTGFEELQADLVDYAKNYLGCKYRRGSKGPTTFDCSGFTSYVFKKFGYNLSPSSITQGTQGEEVSIQDAQVGDLIFFSGRKVSKTIGHVGMITSVDHKTGRINFIHASVGNGIIVSTYPDEPYYNKRFISIRHILSDEEVATN